MPNLKQNKNLIKIPEENISDKKQGGDICVYIQVTSMCNQRCVFCNRPPSLSRTERSVTPLSLIKNKIKELSYNPSVKRIIFTGGEPLMYSQLIDAIRYAKKFHFITEIQTNGTLLSLEKLTILKKTGLDIINFAFHSHIKTISNRLRGVNFGYNDIIRNLKLADKSGFEIHIIHVINSLNYEDLPDFIDFIQKLSLHNLYLNLSIVVPEGWAWENKWIIPRMKNVKPYLLKACKKCEQYKIKFDISEIVPLCIVPGFEKHAVSTVFKVRNLIITDDYFTGKRYINFADLNKEQAMKAPQCTNCTLNNICAGFYPRLKDLYGYKDFKPRHDDPMKIINDILGNNKK
jgi:MoaA/NifB/PqqE/SkfB family radical SAM enzyme